MDLKMIEQEIFNSIKNNDPDFLIDNIQYLNITPENWNELRKCLLAAKAEIIESVLFNDLLKEHIPFQLLFHKACKINDYKMVKTLLKHPQCNPAQYYNRSITVANNKGYSSIVELLWKQKQIKSSLKHNNNDLYSLLIKKEHLIKNIQNM
jgi:hypothetical protein